MVTTVRYERRDLPEDLLSSPLPEDGVDRILELEVFRGLDPSKFPATNSLRDIVRDNVTFRTYAAGDIVVRVGDYGDTAFHLISGSLRVAMPPGLPQSMLGRGSQRNKGFLEALRQASNNPTQPEVRATTGVYPHDGVDSRRLGDRVTRIFLQDVSEVLNEHRTVRLEPGEFCGEIAALGRTPRSTTVVAETDAVVVEIRWQGLRDICRRVDDFRHCIGGRYRERSLGTHLREAPMFHHLDEEVIEKIVGETLLETYGDFEWHATYKRYLDLPAAERLAHEPVIVRQGDYADGLLAGAVRLRPGQQALQSRRAHGELSRPRRRLWLRRDQPRVARGRPERLRLHSARGRLRRRAQGADVDHRGTRAAERSAAGEAACSRLGAVARGRLARGRFRFSGVSGSESLPQGHGRHAHQSRP